MLPSLTQFWVWKMCPWGKVYRPEPLCSISITETSQLLWAHPRILFACWTSFISTYISSPYWIGLSQLWYLTFSETPWPVISAGAPGSISVYTKQMCQPSLSKEKVGLLNNLANDFRQGVDFGLQSSLYAKASQIARPLSRSHFKEQSGRLLPSFHTARYRLACRIYLLGRNG